MNNQYDFTIQSLGDCHCASPIELSTVMDDYMANYVDESRGILFDVTASAGQQTGTITREMLLEMAGPRQNIFFEPAEVHAAIVTCGGLCPGLNDVIRAIVMTLWYRYSVHRITGIPFGYRGFIPEFDLEPRELTPDIVADIHRNGGTILGSSRGYGDRTSEIVDRLESMNINMLFAIGGDGTQKGALDISEEVLRRGKKIAVVGIPKTIDNDLGFIEKSFGFETAVSHAVEAVSGAHVEARDSINGIGIVKVMGRESGFIAAHTALALNDVNFVLVPEVPFDLDGDDGLLAHLHQRLIRRKHAVLLIAEGAGQNLLEAESTQDFSGNRMLADIGTLIKRKIKEYFDGVGLEVNQKYIDPGYMIRSAPANPNDSIYCTRLGNNAVHAAMAGKTGMLIGLVNSHFVHLPIAVAVSTRNQIDPESSLWRDVIEATGQPPLMRNHT